MSKISISDFLGPKKKAKLQDENISRTSHSLSAARCLPSTPEEESSCPGTLLLHDCAGNTDAIASPRPPVDPNIMLDCAGNNDAIASPRPPVDPNCMLALPLANVQQPAPVATTCYSVGEEPCQPKEFHFPARRSASENFSRSFKVGWFGQWTLHYVRQTKSRNSG